MAQPKHISLTNIEEITIDNLKLIPIVSTVGTFYYETAKYLAEYLQPLTVNEYVTKDTTEFPSRLTNRTLGVSYDVTSLFTQVPLEETLDYIIEEIYTKHKLPPISSKLLYKRLLNNVTKKVLFSTAKYIKKSTVVVWEIHFLLLWPTFLWPS